MQIFQLQRSERCHTATLEILVNKHNSCPFEDWFFVLNFNWSAFILWWHLSNFLFLFFFPYCAFIFSKTSNDWLIKYLTWCNTITMTRKQWDDEYNLDTHIAIYCMPFIIVLNPPLLHCFAIAIDAGGNEWWWFKKRKTAAPLSSSSEQVENAVHLNRKNLCEFGSLSFNIQHTVTLSVWKKYDVNIKYQNTTRSLTLRR